MKISKRNLKTIIENYLKQDGELNEVFGTQRFLRTGNQRVDDFKDDLRDRLKQYYKEGGESFLVQLFGSMTRGVASIVKQAWSAHVDRAFIDSVIKVHFTPLDTRKDPLAELEALVNSNKKNEISTVGYLPEEFRNNIKDVELAKQAWYGKNQQARYKVAVKMSGYTTLAANDNLFSGRKPNAEDEEKYAASGVPKFPEYVDPIENIKRKGGFSLSFILGGLRTWLEKITNNIILDEESYMRINDPGRKKLFHNFMWRQGDWNEFIIDNWQIDAFIDVEDLKTRQDEHSIALNNAIETVSQKYGIPYLSIEQIQ